MAQLFQKDCSTPVVDTSITVQESWVNSFDYKYEMVAFGYTLDSETVRDSIIFNSDSSEIEVCHVVTLVDAPNVVDRHVLNIFVAPAREFGPLTFLSDSNHSPQLSSTCFSLSLRYLCWPVWRSTYYNI